MSKILETNCMYEYYRWLDSIMNKHMNTYCNTKREQGGFILPEEAVE